MCRARLEKYPRLLTRSPGRKLSADLVVILAVVAGVALGVVVGLLVGDARTSGAVGALIGLTIGCASTILSPRASQATEVPERRH